MNYYAFHIGDFAAATRHLSWDERAAYREMIDVYYSREAPLPLDNKAIYRLAGATSAKHRQAVDTVLAEFFVKTEDGYRNHRCDEEIAIAAEKAIDSGEKKENEKERQRRHRARRKELFDELREYGIVPPFDASTKALEDMVAKRNGNAPVTRDNIQTQRLTNPNPNPNPNPNSLALASETARAQGDDQGVKGIPEQPPDPPHWQTVQDILASDAQRLDDWELEFLHSVKWKPSLSKAQRDSLAAIQNRLAADAGTTKPDLPTRVMVREGTPAWEAWQAVWRKAGKAGKGGPVTDLRDETGQLIGRGWWFPSEFPPQDTAA